MNTFANTFAEYYPDVLYSTTSTDKQKMRIIWMSLRSIYYDTGTVEEKSQMNDYVVVEPCEFIEDVESAVPAEYAHYIIQKTIELWATMEHEYSYGGTPARIDIMKKYKQKEFLDK